MRRNIVLAIATVLLVASASAASAAQVPSKQARTDTTQNSYRIADHQGRFQVGY
jgi:outer membrane biogenesis lipoprotein LolB